MDNTQRQSLFVKPLDTEESYQKRLHEIEKRPLHPTPEILRHYDLDPGWVPLFYSNDNLSFYEAACAWQEGDAISIQLREAFQKKETYLHFYKKEEILAHEYVHAARFPLHSSIYEEFFAYYLSTYFGSYFRAFVGPIFSTPLDASLFLFAALCPLACLFFDTLFFLLPPLLFIAFYSARLLFRWRRFFRCKKKVGLPLLVRLTDEEIDLFSTLSSLEISSWILSQKEMCFRWRHLYESYCK